MVRWAVFGLLLAVGLKKPFSSSFSFFSCLDKGVGLVAACKDEVCNSDVGRMKR